MLENDRNEEWRPVVGFEGFYSVSNIGRVRSERNCTYSKSGRVLSATLNSRGYTKFNLLRGGECTRKTKTGHILVAEAFIGHRPTTNWQVNHKNGIKTDNRVDNLEWVTAKQNIRHRFDVLGHKSAMGENAGGSKLTAGDVHTIRSNSLAGMSHSAIARRYKVSPGAIGLILRGERWKHLLTVKAKGNAAGEYTPKPEPMPVEAK